MVYELSYMYEKAHSQVRAVQSDGKLDDKGKGHQVLSQRRDKLLLLPLDTRAPILGSSLG